MSDLRELYLDLVEKTVVNQINPEAGVRLEYLLNFALERKEAPSRGWLLKQLAEVHRTKKYVSVLEDLYDPSNWLTKVLSFPLSMIGEKRIRNVRELTEQIITDRVPGALVEAGVWRGGACMMMKAVLKSHDDYRPLFLFDSFAGLPKVDTGPDRDLNLHTNPLLSVELEDVRTLFQRLDLLDSHVNFVKGWFKDTMNSLDQPELDQIALLRLDGDYYSSTLTSLEKLYSRVCVGGYVIVDDYFTYDACKQAVHEFLTQRGLDPTIQDIDGAGAFWRVRESDRVDP